MSKLPQITLYFWIVKICATTLGETAGDLLSMTLNIGYAVTTIILVSGLIAALTIQLLAKTYHASLYWTVILLTSTAGTTMSDYMDRTLGLGYAKGSLILFTGLVTTIAIWRYVEGNVSVNDVKTRRAELFYWAAILFSNTLGTALGDFLADDSGLGFAGGAMLIASLIAVIIAAYYRTHISRIMLFWAAFVLTRPFGATFGDLLTKSHEKGGLDLGTIGSSSVLAILLILFIVLMEKQNNSRKTAV